MCKKVGDKVTVLGEEYILLHDFGNAWHIVDVKTREHYFLYMLNNKEITPCEATVNAVYNQKKRTLSFLGLTFELQEGYDCSVKGTRVFTTKAQKAQRRISFEFPSSYIVDEENCVGKIVCIEQPGSRNIICKAIAATV